MTKIVAALLFKAIGDGSIDECNLLVEEVGANVHEKGEDKYGGWTPILWACNAGYANIVEYLVSRGVNINDKDYNGTSCLMFACREGHLSTAEFLLSKGASIHEMNNYGCTCLSIALEFNRIRILNRLRKWPTTMAILILQELALIYIIDSESVIDLHQYLGRPDDLKVDNEEDYEKDEEGNVLLRPRCRR